MMVIPERSGTAPAAEDDRAGGRGGWRWWRMGGVGWRRWRRRGFGYLCVLEVELLEMEMVEEAVREVVLSNTYLLLGLLLRMCVLEVELDEVEMVEEAVREVVLPNTVLLLGLLLRMCVLEVELDGVEMVEEAVELDEVEMVEACALLEKFLLFLLLQLSFGYLVDGLVLTCALLEVSGWRGWTSSAWWMGGARGGGDSCWACCWSLPGLLWGRVLYSCAIPLALLPPVWLPSGCEGASAGRRCWCGLGFLCWAGGWVRGLRWGRWCRYWHHSAAPHYLALLWPLMGSLLPCWHRLPASGGG